MVKERPSKLKLERETKEDIQGIIDDLGRSKEEIERKIIRLKKNHNRFLILIDKKKIDDDD